MIIETRELSKFYGKARGVEKLDLAVEEGDIFGFIGPNGAGKSTTIRILLGLVRKSGGSAKLFGRECGPGCREILADTGYMPAEAMFYPGMRVGEVIALSAGLRRRDCAAEAKRLCERLELDTKKRVEALSLGNRKKLSVVCALQHKPALLILDEPTSGLDPLMQQAFFALLMERHREGATIFLSSHVLSEIQRRCLHAAVIREGRVILSDAVERLTQSGARRVSLHGVEEAPNLAGIADVQRGGGWVSFLYSGNMQRLAAALGDMPITDLHVSEPDIEEVFMHFYRGKGI